MREDMLVPREWEEYIGPPAGPVEFWKLEELGYENGTLCPEERDIRGGREYVFRVRKVFCEHMQREDRGEDYALLVMVSGSGKREVMDRDEGEEGLSWSALVNVPVGPGTVTVYIVSEWDGQDGKGLDPETLKRSMGRKAMQFEGIAQWEVR
jgi:hypothetical protein